MLHYLQWVYLYLPARKKSSKQDIHSIIIKPISYVHDNYQQMGTSVDNTYQYFYADYKNPIDTGTLSYNPTLLQTGGKEFKPIPQEPCKYRIYTYCEELKLYVPIFLDGTLDKECTDKSLYDNKQTFNLTPNIEYYYREEQASEGDLLHKELEVFMIDNDNNIILPAEKYDNKIHNRVETDIEIDENNIKHSILKLRHYPKFVKIYTTFDKKSEVSIVAEHSGLIDFTEVGYMGNCKLREDYNNQLGGGVFGTGGCEVCSSSLHRVFPNKFRITYMEQDIGGLNIRTEKIKRASKTVQVVAQQLIKSRVNPGSFLYGGGDIGLAKAIDVTLPDPCSVRYYLGDALLHTGEEIAWCDNGHPAYEAFQDPEDREYGHYFYVPNDGSSDDTAIAGSGAQIINTFWFRKYPSTFAALTETRYTVSEGDLQWIYYRAPYNYSTIRKITLKGNRKQEIDSTQSSSFNKPLVQLLISRPKYEAEYTDETRDGEITITDRVLAESEYGYAWAGIEDVVGMASWAMPQITKYDPDGNFSNPYFQWNCQSNMPLYLAWGQYENSDTDDFTKDTVSIAEAYDSKDPLLPFDSPIIRKGKIANYDISYAKYDEDKFNFINENCDKGCSCVVSYVKTTRQNYFNFIHEYDPSLRDDWLVK